MAIGEDKLRMYESVWLQLRDSKTLKSGVRQIVLDAPAAYHYRIRKAIIKEKKLDLAHRLDNETTGGITRLRMRSDGRRLIVELVYVL